MRNMRSKNFLRFITLEH